MNRPFLTQETAIISNPVWVKTLKLVQKPQDPSLTIPTIIKSSEYYDGFGRIIQSRLLCPDIPDEIETFGDYYTVISTNALDYQFSGPESACKALVSGKKIYNNKGKVIKQYEPYWSNGLDLTNDVASGVYLTLFYDPRGQLIRTINPDASEQRLIFGEFIGNDFTQPDLGMTNIYRFSLFTQIRKKSPSTI